jgi:peptidyl-prolyl cis-trans isomerase C/foldase protein PrsA
MKKNNQFVIASVRHILIMTTDPSTNKVVHTDAAAKALATGYRSQLLKGTDFATLAKKVSEDPGSKANGGLYADADVNSWVTEFKDAAIHQKLNAIGPLVKTSYGYHIIRVEKRTNKPLSEVKSAVDNELVQAKLQAYTEKTIAPLIKKITIPN